MRAPAGRHREMLERGGAQVMRYSRAETGRMSIIYCISNTDISSAKKLHLPPLSLQKRFAKLISRNKSVLHLTLPSSKSVFPNASFQGEMQLADPSLSILRSFYRIKKKTQKTNFEKFKLFSAACSVAAANRAGS